LLGILVGQVYSSDLFPADRIETEIAKILGATKNIVARDSKTFAKEISKYIDSKDQKRGDKKDKKKSKEKSLMDQVREAAGGRKEKKDDADNPALWPLIRQVNVRCPSAALSTGAVLVDLPGMRGSICATSCLRIGVLFFQVWRMLMLLEITSPRIT
jgi:hypothetical protein